MKKNRQARKLKISKDTVMSLESSQLRKPNGGICMTSLEQHSCPTALKTCTTL